MSDIVRTSVMETDSKLIKKQVENNTEDKLIRHPVIGIGGGGSTPVLESLTVTANGTYTPPEGVDGYNEVIVDVRPQQPDFGLIRHFDFTKSEYDLITGQHAILHNLERNNDGIVFTDTNNTARYIDPKLVFGDEGADSDVIYKLELTFGNFERLASAGDWTTLFFINGNIPYHLRRDGTSLRYQVPRGSSTYYGTNTDIDTVNEMMTDSVLTVEFSFNSNGEICWHDIYLNKEDAVFIAVPPTDAFIISGTTLITSFLIGRNGTGEYKSVYNMTVKDIKLYRTEV